MPFAFSKLIIATAGMDKSRESWGAYGRLSYYIRKYSSFSEAFDQEASCKRDIFIWFLCKRGADENSEFYRTIMREKVLVA